MTDAGRDGSRITIVDYGVVNLRSIVHKLDRIGVVAEIASTPDALEQATALILPGVGHFAYGMRCLMERGMAGAIKRLVEGSGVPILGICLGMQLLTDWSEEGDVPGLGLIGGRTVRIDAQSTAGLRVPHMGWNSLKWDVMHPIFHGLDVDQQFYFVHSYRVVCTRSADVMATTQYGSSFASVIGRDHVLGVQFHPEKSHLEGMRLLRNFVEMSERVS